LSPPLIISGPEIEDLFDRLARALDKTLDWATREQLRAARNRDAKTANRHSDYAL